MGMRTSGRWRSTKGRRRSPTQPRPLDVGEAVEVGLRFLAPRPRSEREIRGRLARHDVAEEVVEGALEALRAQGLADDRAFASYWVDQRRTFRPRGVCLIKAELRQKGVAGDVAEEATGMEANEEDEAYRAAHKRARQCLAAGVDERTFRLRVSQLLVRRGFGWAVIPPVVARLWTDGQEAAVSRSAGSDRSPTA